MEQITDPKTLIDLAEPEHVAVETPIEALPDPTRAWVRLNHVALNHRALARNGIVSDTHDPRSIPFERLAARLVRHVKKSGATRVGLTTATTGCGTSTLAANLALALAGQANLRTILFDFDLRKPSLIGKFDLERIGPKYSALTAGRRSFDSTALRLSDGLTLSLNATSEPDPATLLTATTTRDLLQDIQNDFAPDLVLFDLPPLFPMPDTLLALSLLDGAYIVAKSGQSTVPEIDAAERAIREHCTCFGTILTDCRFADPLTHGQS